MFFGIKTFWYNVAGQRLKHKWGNLMKQWGYDEIESSRLRWSWQREGLDHNLHPEWSGTLHRRIYNHATKNLTDALYVSSFCILFMSDVSICFIFCSYIFFYVSKPSLIILWCLLHPCPKLTSQEDSSSEIESKMAWHAWHQFFFQRGQVSRCLLWNLTMIKQRWRFMKVGGSWMKINIHESFMNIHDESGINMCIK